MDAVEAAEAQGYTVEAYNEIDKEVAESEKCSECGGRMFYVGRRMPEDFRAYRAFAVCETCNHSEEF